MRNLFCILLFSLALGACTNSEQKSTDPSVPSGKVISILDGDTYELLLDGKPTRVRMEGIDAPEKGMPYYKVAKRHLGDLCFGKVVQLKVTGPDKYGRTLAFSYLEDGTELGHEMIKAGMAWHYTKYSSDPELAALEIEARKNKIGLWADENPMAPWENRKLHRAGISTVDSFATSNEQ